MGSLCVLILLSVDKEKFNFQTGHSFVQPCYNKPEAESLYHYDGPSIFFYIHKKGYVRGRLITVITQFWVTRPMNCQMLTHCINVSYAVGHI
jgi:hypothetical protein